MQVVGFTTARCLDRYLPLQTCGQQQWGMTKCLQLYCCLYFKCFSISTRKRKSRPRFKILKPPNLTLFFLFNLNFKRLIKFALPYLYLSDNRIKVSFHIKRPSISWNTAAIVVFFVARFVTTF